MESAFPERQGRLRALRSGDGHRAHLCAPALPGFWAFTDALQWFHWYQWQRFICTHSKCCRVGAEAAGAAGTGGAGQWKMVCRSLHFMDFPCTCFSGILVSLKWGFGVSVWALQSWVGVITGCTVADFAAPVCAPHFWWVWREISKDLSGAVMALPGLGKCPRNASKSFCSASSGVMQQEEGHRNASALHEWVWEGSWSCSGAQGSILWRVAQGSQSSQKLLEVRGNPAQAEHIPQGWESLLFSAWDTPAGKPPKVRDF